MRGGIYSWIHRVWYDGAPGYWLLLPLSALYRLVISLRRAAYRLGLRRRVRVAAPVVVVGNITAGGTGKTPVTVWLAEALAGRGWRPGIVSRGYGGERAESPMLVTGDSAATEVGDEPLLLARRTGCPVVVDSDRAAAAARLLETDVNIVIADDGLQHLRLERDFEICVVDAARMLGNGWLLPAGPLREPAGRLRTVDQVLLNGRANDASGMPVTAIGFELRPGDVTRLNGTGRKPLADFRGATVHAVAAIGNPGRFFALLRAAGLDVIEHALPDHAELSVAQLVFDDDFAILMTEKDAVKLGSDCADRLWYLPVDLAMDPADATACLDALETAARRSPAYIERKSL